jgi:drug/metabolite transporter (DMT)-like permease
MPLPYAGQLAALATASCWVASSLAFETAARRLGPLVVNVLRLILAFLLLLPLCAVVRGRPFPTDASPRTWLLLGISGLVGFTFGDFCLFRCYLILGPRLTNVMMALAPPLTALIGWLLLGETLSGRALLGMALTVVGVSWAILEGHRPAGANGAAWNGDLHPRHPLAGVALGAGGALGQAGGLVLSKLGMGSYSPFAATQIRLLAGFAGTAVILTLLGGWSRVWRSRTDGPALRSVAVGAFFGPFLGVSLSLIAVQRTLAGVAASLMALTPVLIIPPVVLFRGERVGPGGIVGAGIAVGGVVLLFL